MTLMVGCFDKNAFDFSRLNNFEAEGTWGIPLANTTYTIGDILAMADNPDFLVPGSDGVLEICYEFEKDSVFSASTYLNQYLETLTVSDSKTYPVSVLPAPAGGVQVLYRDTIEAQFPEDVVRLSSAQLSSGKLTVKIHYNIPREVRLVLSCPQLQSGSGQSYHIEETSSGGYYEHTFDFSGYSLVVPSDNMVNIFLDVTCPTGGPALPDVLTFSYEATFENVSFSEVRGNFATVSLPVEADFDFDLNYIADHFSGSIEVLNPKIDCQVMNTFPVDARVVIDEATLHGTGVSSSLLATSPTTLSLPANTNGFVSVPFPLAPSITLSPTFRQFTFKGEASINTPGLNGQELVLTADQIIHVRFKVSLPLKVKLNQLSFSDTLDFPGVEVPDESAFTNLLLRLGVYNGLPLNFSVQGYFYDSQTETLRDSLFTEYKPVLSSVNGEERLTELFVAKEDLHAVQEMLSCDKIILRAMLNTNGIPAAISADQKLKLELSARFDVNVNTLVHQQNP